MDFVLFCEIALEIVAKILVKINKKVIDEVANSKNILYNINVRIYAIQFVVL